jgi:hypothetical protein
MSTVWRKGLRRGGGWGLLFLLWFLLASSAHAADPVGPPDAAGSGGGGINVWPVYDERDDPVDRMHVQSGLGPLLAFGRSPNDVVENRAFRPLFYWRKDTQPERLEWEVLYPLMAYSRVEEDSKFQFLQLLNFRHEGSDPKAREDRYELFPVYASGTTETGRKYLAILPFGGSAPNWWFQDEAEFVLFPLYARFVREGAETRYFPWPILSVTSGEKRSGFRVVPLYGQDVKEGVFEKRFVLWPLFLQQRTGLDGDSPEETLSILPFYVSQRSKNQERTSVLWPFFSYAEDREHRFKQWDVPWPLIQIARGEERTVNRFLPLFSVEHRVVREQLFLREMQRDTYLVLFPLYIRTEDTFIGSLKVRDRILWWLYSDQRETGKDGSTRRVDAWPFFRYTRDREGAIQFQTLALLEAFMPGDEKIERNYSPLWALYTYRQNPEGDSVWAFLWDLLRHEETSTGRSIEVLGPVLAYQERGEDARFSLLGGLFECDVNHGIRSVHLLGHVAFTWTGTPQRLAALDPAGGTR